MHGLFAELNRRNVTRVAVAYAVAGWLVTEVASVVLPTFGAPDWVLRVLITMLAIGFPVVLAFSWIYELTPEGLKKESDIAPGDSITAHTARKLDLVVIVLLIVTGTIVIADRFLPDADDTPGATVPDKVAESAPASVPTDESSLSSGSSAASVAVLAFENMSPDPDNAYFAEGISEEILNVLAGIEGLQVASRTSAFSFAGRDTPIPEIARQLDVANVLEGSVRRQGNRVRITAQLIDAGTDKHLWSDTFDRDLDDIFAVQEEIGQAIAEALGAALGVAGLGLDAPTRDMAAYELFLRGRQLFYRRGEALTQSMDDLRAAVDRDPEFAEAWAFLSAASYVSTTGYFQLEPEQSESLIEQALTATDQALALDPDLALAVAVRGHLAEGRLQKVEGLDQAVAMAPDDAGLLMWAGTERLHVGAYTDQVLPMLEKAYRLDPLVGINNGALGFAYLTDGQFELGQRHIQRAIELGWSATAQSLLMTLLTRGEPEAALSLVRQTHPAREADWSEADHEQWALEQRLVDGSISPAELAQLNLAGIGYLATGDLDGLFDHFEANMDAVWVQQLYFSRYLYVPGGQPAVEHPRFLKFAEKLDLIRVWEELGYPMGCERVQDEIGDHLACSQWPQ